MFVALLLLKFSNVIFGNISSKPKYYFDNILFKTQVLLLVIFLQKPKYYFSNILHTKKKKKKKPNIILAVFYKSPILFWQHFIKNPKLLIFGQTIIPWKSKYYLAKILYYA